MLRLRGGGCGASKVDIFGDTLTGPIDAEALASNLITDGLMRAIVAQQAISDAAAGAGYMEKTVHGSAYKIHGLRQLEPLLAHIDLIDVHYLIGVAEAGGIVPRWQDVPTSAFITIENFWRLRCCGVMPILVLSYPWLDSHHPDKHGATLRRILPILRACRDQALRFGEHATFGVFWDYMSLPQEPNRTSTEYVRYKNGLATMVGCAPRTRIHPTTRLLRAPSRAAAFTCTRGRSC
jgi:hypothetical protein